MAYAEYMIELNRVIEKHKIPYPSNLIDHWKQVYFEFKDGYNESLYFLDQDLYVRDQIELLLSQEELYRFEEFQEVVRQLKYYDDEIKKVLLLDIIGNDKLSLKWWHRCLPRFATADFIDEVKRQYGEVAASKITQVAEP